MHVIFVIVSSTCYMFHATLTWKPATIEDRNMSQPLWYVLK